MVSTWSYWEFNIIAFKNTPSHAFAPNFAYASNFALNMNYEI